MKQKLHNMPSINCISIWGQFVILENLGLKNKYLSSKNYFIQTVMSRKYFSKLIDPENHYIKPQCTKKKIFLNVEKIITNIK